MSVNADGAEMIGADIVVAAWMYDPRSSRKMAHFCNTVPKLMRGFRYYDGMCGVRLSEYTRAPAERVVRSTDDQRRCQRCEAARTRQAGRVAATLAAGSPRDGATV